MAEIAGRGRGARLWRRADDGNRCLNPEDRRAALAQVQATGEKAAVLNLLIASDPAEDATATLEALNRIEADATLPQVWRDLAVLRRIGVQGRDLPLADRRAALEPLAQPGRSFRVLAAEQLAYLLIEEGKTPEAISALQALTQDQEATGGCVTVPSR
ncbi:hypothetical protein ACFSHQ_13855 [Gemmobacter lanyuensis]